MKTRICTKLKKIDESLKRVVNIYHKNELKNTPTKYL